jgi:ABC-type multidrug transport system ATPase subunit
MTPYPIIRIEQLRKDYSGLTVLALDNIVLQSGDRAVISGANGSGKSTLLKILAGLIRISGGNEFRCANWKELSIGFLPQDGGIYRDLSVRENLVVSRRMLGQPHDQDRSIMLADRFGLTDLLDKRVELLSGGYRRLVALFCLLSSGADLLFLDEPFASIDPTKQLAIEDALKQLANNFQLIVISEHINNIPVADRLSFWSKQIPLELQGHAHTAQT